MDKNIVKRGVKAATTSGGAGGRFLSLVSDEPVDVVLMEGTEGLLSVDTHSWWDYNPAPHLVCLGPNCPSCILGNEVKVNSYIPVVTREREVKFFVVKMSIIRALQKYESAVGDLTGRLVQLEKTGTGLKTRYSVLPLGKKLDVSGFEIPDLEPLLGPLTLDEQLARMEEAGIDVSSVRATIAARKRKKKDDVETEEVAEALDFSVEDEVSAEGGEWAPF